MQKRNGSITAWWKARIQKNPAFAYVLYAAFGLAAVLFYVIGSGLHCGGQTAAAPITRTETSSESVRNRDDLEQRLVEVLSKIRGAGRVDVLVTYETNGEIVTATVRQTDEDVKDANGTAGTETSRSVREVTEPATIETGNGHAPIVLYEKEPVVRGVIVVAEGASDFSVREKLQAAVHAATGIPIERIEVFEMAYIGS